MGIIVATFIVVVVIASALSQDLAIFSWNYWLEGGNALRSEVVRNLGLLAAAVIGLAVGSWRAALGYMQAQASQQQAAAANEQAGIAQQGQITERFSRAAEQLGHDRVAVRIGGLYALKRIAEDSMERDHLAVMDVLTNFIRQPPYAKEQREAAERDEALRAFKANSTEENTEVRQIASPPKPELIDCPDIVAAIGVIQGRSEDQKAVEDKWEYRLSLSRASLSYLRNLEVDLQYFDLVGADLTSANLTSANLTSANLTSANLTNARLTNANLTEANLTNANLTEANLTGADLTGAENLTQRQLDVARYDPDDPPELPPGLVLREPPPEPPAE